MPFGACDTFTLNQTWRVLSVLTLFKLIHQTLITLIQLHSPHLISRWLLEVLGIPGSMFRDWSILIVFVVIRLSYFLDYLERIRLSRVVAPTLLSIQRSGINHILVLNSLTHYQFLYLLLPGVGGDPWFVPSTATGVTLTP